jgi:cbb3-type cytochrome oxidase maturation protein
MDVLFLLVPLSVGLVLILMAVFAWALHDGQFDEIEREGERILDDAGATPNLDADQSRAAEPARHLPP